MLDSHALAAAASAATAAQGELVKLDWSAEGGFSQALRLAPARFVEVCGPLAAQVRVQWHFEAGGVLDFNIHYHEGQAVHFPAQQRAVAKSAGTLVAPVAQDYCWMWTNKSAAEVALRFVLTKR